MTCHITYYVIRCEERQYEDIDTSLYVPMCDADLSDNIPVCAQV
jgi:hypothetical protein